MNQRNIIAAVAAFVVIVLGAWFFFFRGSNDEYQTIDTGGTATSTGQTATSTATSTGPALKGSQKSGNTQTQGSTGAVFAQGGNYTCTVETMGTTTRTTGTVYGSGSKTRLDYDIVSNDGTMVKMHIIKNGSVSYTWVDGQSVGFKRTVSASSTVVPIPSGGVIMETDLANISSTCHPWLPNSAEFTTPSGITFE